MAKRTSSPQSAPRGKWKKTEAPVSATDARTLAWEILQRVEDGAYADALLGHRLSRSGLAARDQALATRLVYGTLAWQGYLDHIIGAFSQRPPAALDVPVRTVLRLALFQMCLLTKIPTFAAVDTAVNLIKRFRGGSATSIVNAVLRRASAGWHTVDFPSRQTDPIGFLTIRLSHPRWLVERWNARYGIDDTEALLRANNEPAPTVLRVNRRATDPAELLARLRAAGHTAEPGTYSPLAIRIEHGGAPEQLVGYEDGVFSVQGEASQLIGYLLNPQPGDRVLDACAAPGGKTTHLAELMDDRGEVIALDSNARGIERLDGMARRLHLSIIKSTVADATATSLPVAISGNAEGLGEAAPFDCVLVDAPCSGLGTLREHPELKWRRIAPDCARLARLQLSLLSRVAACVRPGGTLVYATCTLSSEENDDVVASFVAAHPMFAVDDPRPLLPPNAGVLIGNDGILRTLPHRHGLDGFFGVRLKRRDAHDIVRL